MVRTVAQIRGSGARKQCDGPSVSQRIMMVMIDDDDDL